MKTRPSGFLSLEVVPEETFDYVRELHDYLWRFVRLIDPGASGSLSDFVDKALADLASRDQALRACVEALVKIRGLLVVRPHRFADQTERIHAVLDDILALPAVARVSQRRASCASRSS